MWKGLVYLFSVVCLWLGMYAAKATTFLEFQSTYLGDGWFQYQIQMMADPFFTSADISGLGINFSDQIDQVGDSTNWSYTGISGGQSSWAFTNGYSARPFVKTFLVRSSQTSYKLGAWSTNALGPALFSLDLSLSSIYPGTASGVYAANIVGYASVPCLIPCTAAEADGSPTNFVYDLKLLPDIQINRLIQQNGGIYGVDFLWGSESTLLLQGSPDFHSWTNIAYLWSYPPETSWTTNTDLGAYGHFFRLELVADGHATHLVPWSAAKVPALKAQPKGGSGPLVIRSQYIGGQIVVSVSSMPGQVVQVQAIDPRGKVLQTQQVVNTGRSATATFSPATLPSVVFFQAVLVP